MPLHERLVLCAHEPWRQRALSGRTGHHCRQEHDRDTADDHLDTLDLDKFAYAVQLLTQSPGQAEAPTLRFVLSFDLDDVLHNRLLLHRQVAMQRSALTISRKVGEVVIGGRLPRHSIVVCPGNGGARRGHRV
jgi:hypothetical protein